MRNRIFLLVLIIPLLFCSCKSSESVKIINADNIQGAEIKKTAEEEIVTDIISETTEKESTSTERIYSSESPQSTAVSSLPTEQSYQTMQTTALEESSQTAASVTTEPSTAPPITTTSPPSSEPLTESTVTTTFTTTTVKYSETEETDVESSLTEAEEELMEITETNVSDYTPLNYDETVGVWISYIELASVLKGKSESSFRNGFSEMMDNCVSLGINTVYVHLRAFGDAFYPSEYFPWSSYVTGTVGKVPDFDPLSVMLEEAHSRGISFHGWINPMRINSSAEITSVGDKYLTGKWYKGEENGNYVVKNGDYWYLNPAYGEAVRLVADGAYEIVSKYDVDGLHIDDYFYPSTDASFDKKAFEKSGFLDLADFRFNNCSKLVKSIYNAVKNANPNALFGISPQGSVANNYNYLYADVKTWCEGGYCDYIAPQIYYGFENSLQPYAECLSVWHDMTENSKIKVIPGLAAYKVGKEDIWAGEKGKNEWINNADILKRQIEEARGYSDYSGFVFYSYNHLFSKDYVTDAHMAEINTMLHLLG